MLRGCKCPFTRGAFLCPCASFGLLLLERVGDGIPTRRVRSSSLFSFYLQLCILACQTTGCRSPMLFSYEGPAVFAPYLRMRSVAPLLTPIIFLWEVNSSSYGVSIWMYCHTVRLRKFVGCLTVPYSPIQRRVSRYDVLYVQRLGNSSNQWDINLVL
jgi:hypothetical protein